MAVALSPGPELPPVSGGGPACFGDAGYSRFVQRIRRRYAGHMQVLPAGPPLRAGMQTAFEALQATGLDTGAALRVLRQLVIERLVVLDCERQAPLAAVMQAMTELAELALDAAVQDTDAMLDALYGPPRTPDGARARLWVVGMGKLGARELNVSSDIDLIYVYDHDGDTAVVAISPTTSISRIRSAPSSA